MTRTNSRRAKRLPTSITIPVDPQFVEHFCVGGWQRVERIYGKRRVQTWTAVVGRERLKQMRRDAVKGNKSTAVEIRGNQGA